MTDAVRGQWEYFLERKFSDLSSWIQEFDENVLQGAGEDFEISESDIDELANSLDEIYTCLVENGLIG